MLPATIVATAALSLLYVIGCVVLRLVAPPLKSASPYVLAGSALNTNGCTCGTAPIPNEPKLLTVAFTELAVLLPAPIGNAHEEPVFMIRPISVSGKVANVD